MFRVVQQEDLVAWNVYRRKRFSSLSGLPPIYELLGEVLAPSKEAAEKAARKLFDTDHLIVYKKEITYADSRVGTE